MTIEKEFFETFKGINKLYSTWVDEYSNSDYPNYRYKTFKSYNEAGEKMVDERWDFEDGDFVKNTIDGHYPPITPEIVLGLVKLALDNGWKFTQYKTGEYVIERNSHEYCVIDKSFEDAILILFIELKKYPKSFNEIQDQVKALFSTNRMELLND